VIIVSKFSIFGIFANSSIRKYTSLGNVEDFRGEQFKPEGSTNVYYIIPQYGTTLNNRTTRISESVRVVLTGGAIKISGTSVPAGTLEIN
jgi:hypothetical protein